jgi:hypothetical protein
MKARSSRMHPRMISRLEAIMTKPKPRKSKNVIRKLPNIERKFLLEKMWNM